MMQMSRTKLIVTALVVLLAIVGWAMYGAIRSGYDRQEARFADERAQLTARIETLSGERDQLAARRTELEQTLEKERAAAGDLASLRERIDTAAGALKQRMETLGARERDLASIDASLAEAKESWRGSRSSRPRQSRGLAPGSRRWADASASCPGGTCAGQDRARQQALTASLDQLTKSVDEKRTALGALNLELGTLERDRSHRANDLATVEAELAATRTNLDQVQAQLDKALLAQSVADLQARQATLQEQLTKPRRRARRTRSRCSRAASISVGRSRHSTSSCARSPLSVPSAPSEFSDVVTRIEQPAPGPSAGAGQETGSLTATAAAHTPNRARPTANAAALSPKQAQKRASRGPPVNSASSDHRPSGRLPQREC